MAFSLNRKIWRRALCAALALLALAGILAVLLRPAKAVAATTGRITIHDVQTVNARRRSMQTERDELLSGGRADGLVKAVTEANPELTYNAFTLGDIPLLEVCRGESAEKPLLLFLHGVTMEKESVLYALAAFAEAGYCAVSMDAYDQGERQDEQAVCDNWAAALITVRDIDQVVEYYDRRTDVDVENFVLGGFSMGAIESWAYVQMGEYEPGALLPMSGICQTDAWHPWRMAEMVNSWLEEYEGWGVGLSYGGQNEDYTQEKYESISALNIEDHLEDYADIPIFCGVGTWDWYFNSNAAGKVIDAIAGAGNENAVFKAYEGTGHVLSQQMVADAVDFLETL